MAAGWTIQQITHCSASLVCSDTLANHSSPATALGEADPTTSATISKQAGRALTSAAVATAATLQRQIVKTVSASTVTLGSAVKQARKTVSSTGSSAAALATTYIPYGGVSNPLTLTTAAVGTAATLGAVKVPYVPAGVGEQGIAQLVAAVGGGIGV
jgi:hypothetical protein